MNILCSPYRTKAPWIDISPHNMLNYNWLYPSLTARRDVYLEMIFQQQTFFLRKIKSLFYSAAIALSATPALTSAAESWSPSDVREHTMTPESIVQTHNLQDIVKKQPEISRHLALMEKLPLTGKPVFDRLTSPESRITIKLFPIPANFPVVQGRYSTRDRLLEIPRGAKTGVTFHESFHAVQDVINETRLILTRKDTALSMLLTEATAVAYAIAAEHEANSLGLKFFEPAPFLTDTADGPVLTTIVTAASNPKTRAVFQAAYDQAWEENTASENRQAKALEAGGKSVVRHLLEWKDPEWQRAYSRLVLNYIGSDKHRFITEEQINETYAPERSIDYSKLGGALPNINFVPEEYLGPDADKYIDACFKGMSPEAPVQAKPAASPSA